MVCNIDSLKKDAEAARLKLNDMHVSLSLVRKGQSTLDTTKIVQHALTSTWKHEDDYFIPTIQLPLQTIHSTLNDSRVLLAYLDAEEVQGRLGAQECAFSVHHSQDGFLFETSHSEYCDLDREISYDVNAFQKMKEDNSDAWKFKWGCIEYDRIIQKLIQAMLTLDLNLHVGCAELMSSNALSTAMSWYMTEPTGEYAFAAIEHAFGGAPHREIKVRRCKAPLVDINVCNRSWGDDSHGLGFILSTTLTFDVYAKSMNEEGEDVLECILTVRCSVRQGVPIDIRTGITNDGRIRDCHGTQPSSFIGDDSFFLESINGTVHLHLFEPGFRGPFHSPTRSLMSNKKGKPIRDAINEMKAKNTGAIDGILYGWSNSDNSLLSLMGNENVPCADPFTILFEPISAREQIQTIECSDYHMLALTSIGTIYSCGDGSFGQLGHGNLDLYRQLYPVTALVDSKGDRIVITQISVGSNAVGAHSAAVDSDGFLYTWGKSIICGHISELNESGSVESYTTTPKKIKAMEEYKVSKISCGGGFTVALAKIRPANDKNIITLNEVKVFSWGIIAQGRLGLGKPKVEVESDLFGRKRLKRMQTCEISPQIIQGLILIVDISAGANYCLAASSDGKIIAWGSNAFGQCGVTELDQSKVQTMHLQGQRDRYNGIKEDKSASLWDDIWVPRELSTLNTTGDISFKSVSAGGVHSAAIDQNGLLYTWGGGGKSNCLGHGDLLQYEYGKDERTDSHRREVLAMSGRLVVPHWSSPRAVDCLQGERISLVSLGEKHNVAVSETGSMHVWGDESCTLQKAENSDDQEGMNSLPYLPVKPNHSIFPSLEGKRICHAACGMNATFFVASDDWKASDLGTKLYHECQLALHNEKSGQPLVDCILIAAGKPLYCHKIIISQRSRILDQMLILESRPQDPSYFPEVVIPGVPFGTMKSVLCFMYTDMVQNFDTFSFESVLEIWEAAKLLKIHKLMAICKDVLEIDHGYSVKMDNVAKSKLSSFGSDMSNALEDNRYSNVHISVEGKTLQAHKCVLRCASTYFANLITEASRGSMSSGSRIDLELPGTYASLVRSLLFLYTGYLPSMTQSDLVEDLITAHRYQLKYQGSIDGSIQVTPSNACEMLLLAVRVQSPRLKIHALNTIANNLYKQVENDAMKEQFESMLSQCPPQIKDELFEKIKDVNGLSCLISKDRRNLAAAMLERSRLYKSSMEAKMAKDFTGDTDALSIRNLFVVLLLVVVYGYLQHYPSFKAVIPILNSLVLIMTVIHLFHKIQ